MKIFKNFFCVLLLAVSAQAAVLTCSFDGTQTSGCNTYTLSPVTQVNEDISVPNAPFTPYTDNMTTSLYFDPSQVTIQEFPRKLFGIFTNVNSFQAQNISMSELGTDSFYNCINLYSIYMMYSNLGNIRAGFASTCYFVQSLYISYSNIASIDENAFQGMLTLQMISLSYSELTCIPPLLFQPLKGLHSIDLSYNKLTAIHSQQFAGLTGLYQISLMENQIGYIPNFNFDRTGTGYGSSSLSVSLYNNPIRAIHPLFMTSLYNNRILGSNYYAYIYFMPSDPQNITTCINPNYTQTMTNYPGDLYTIGQTSYDWIRQNTTYQYLTTCYSDFTAVMGSDSLVNCGSVITTTTTVSPGGSTTPGGSGSGSGQCATDKICRYYLDWNNTYTCVIDGAEGTVTSISGAHYLSFVDSDVARVYFTNSNLNLVPNILFQKFINLKYLHVANAGLSVINDQTFNECGNLELLDASNNNIIHVDETALRNCTKLRVIDLTGNQINYVSGGLYQLDPALERVHLTRLDDWILA